MKLLGWMHRKFRQNSGEIQKDFSNGQPSLEDFEYFPKRSYSTKPLGKSQREKYRRNSFTSLETAREEEEYREQEPPLAYTELFHGFLAIGTLGTEPTPTDPATPAFPISVDHIAEKETEVTETELKLINDELEKLLIADAKDEVSSGRNSHVSAGRSSHCSTITIGGKPIEAAEGYGNGGITCPLQSYLLGSRIGLQDTTAPSAKREFRTSLGELFQKTKEDNPGSKLEMGEKRFEKETDKSAVHLVKKMLKKKLLHASSKKGGTIDSATAEKKINKILQMFSRKVHPECSFNQQTPKPTKNEIKTNNPQWTSSENGSLRPSVDDITIYPQGPISRETIWEVRSQSQSSQCTPSNGDASGNEFWVKSDDDYLVLEL